MINNKPYPKSKGLKRKLSLKSESPQKDVGWRGPLPLNTVFCHFEKNQAEASGRPVNGPVSGEHPTSVDRVVSLNRVIWPLAPRANKLRFFLSAAPSPPALRVMAVKHIAHRGRRRPCVFSVSRTELQRGTKAPQGGGSSEGSEGLELRIKGARRSETGERKLYFVRKYWPFEEKYAISNFVSKEIWNWGFNV